ncbi:hypothetical protein DSO57_1039304 [Entomophthora muscae]|uniref:Uncharacterized protein n=1 Tax=Entomophthora muscae TaxID=34485 RepID=A0ACC2U822_9FUNG|nr:hypothetical protein DSO57_1039304 [Entomophthora muscae]
MAFNSNIFDGASNQDSSSQASFNRDEAQNTEAPVYIQSFDAGNKEADLYSTPNPNPYGFDLFNSHLVSSSSPAPLPTPAQTSNQPVGAQSALDSQLASLEVIKHTA